jgi:hypothetical protein
MAPTVPRTLIEGSRAAGQQGSASAREEKPQTTIVTAWTQKLAFASAPLFQNFASRLSLTYDVKRKFLFTTSSGD